VNMCELAYNLDSPSYPFPVTSHFLQASLNPILCCLPCNLNLRECHTFICRNPIANTTKIHVQNQKGFQLLGGFAPRPPDQGLCPWTLLGAPPPEPRYRLALPRSPYLGAPLKFVLAPLASSSGAGAVNAACCATCCLTRTTNH